MTDSKARGKNIKLFDKIKIQHVQTNYRIHSLDHEWRNGSYNQAVGCHKAMDETDWFIVLKSDVDENNRSNLSYHFVYGDKILLSNVGAKKYLHVTSDFPSQISKNHQVSLCHNGEGSPGCIEDQWQVINASVTSDNYWRVGEQIKLKNVHFESNLCSIQRKLRESGDFEIFVRNKDNEDKKKSDLDLQYQQIWMVSQIESFIYSANLSEKKVQKKVQEAQQIENLKRAKSQMSKKNLQKNENSTNDLLKLGNQRLAQIESEKKKMLACEKSESLWQKIIKCRFCCPRQDQYRLIN